MRLSFSLVTCILLIFVFADCHKQGGTTPNNSSSNTVVWICNGTDSKGYAKEDSARVFNGVDSVWMYFSTSADSDIAISNQLITVISKDDSTIIVTNLVNGAYYTFGGPYPFDTTAIKWDTLHLIAANGAYQLDYEGVHTGLGVDIRLVYNSPESISLQYDWYVPGPSYGDLGSDIILTGSKK